MYGFVPLSTLGDRIPTIRERTKTSLLMIREFLAVPYRTNRNVRVNYLDLCRCDWNHGSCVTMWRRVRPHCGVYTPYRPFRTLRNKSHLLHAYVKFKITVKDSENQQTLNFSWTWTFANSARSQIRFFIRFKRHVVRCGWWPIVGWSHNWPAGSKASTCEYPYGARPQSFNNVRHGLL